MDHIHDPRNAIRTVTSAAQAQCEYDFLLFSEARRLDHPVLCIVTLVNFWHATGGLYM
jgi:hypothetical protein